MKPGDAFFARTDLRFSHEYVTPMADALFRHGFGADAKVTEPESVFAFRDHLTFLDLIMPKAHKDMGLDVQARKLATVQDDFAKRANVKVYGEVWSPRREAFVGSEAICHNMVIEELALPGQLVIGVRQPYVHGGSARLLRVRGGADGHGQRVAHTATCASPSRRPRASSFAGAAQAFAPKT